MANGAKLFEVIYVDTQESVPVLVGIGDTIRATAWAEKEYPFPPKPDLSADLTEAELEFNREEYRDAKFAVDAAAGESRRPVRRLPRRQAGQPARRRRRRLGRLAVHGHDAGRRRRPAEETARGGIQRAIERSLARVALDSLQPVGDLCDLLGVPRYRPGVFARHGRPALRRRRRVRRIRRARRGSPALGHRLTRGR